MVDRRGRIVARSLSLGGGVLPAKRLLEQAITHGRSSYAGLEFGDEDLRAYIAPLAEVGGPAAGGAVIVAGSTHDLTDTLASLHLFVLVAGLAASALGALAVAILMTRALRPLGELADPRQTSSAPAIRAAACRSPLRGDEVGTLAATLNEMLASLERARDNERRFLADASHELRTPLTALRGNVAYLARHGATPELVAELGADAERLARLADDLLALSREESAGEPTEVIRLDELARAASGPRIEAGTLEPVAVKGDRAALERALANLVRNAELYGPEGGRITVDAEQRERRCPADRRRRGRRARAGGGGAGVRTLLARRRRQARLGPRASRSSERRPSAIAAAPTRRARALRSSSRLSENLSESEHKTQGQSSGKGSL